MSPLSRSEFRHAQTRYGSFGAAEKPLETAR